MVELGSGSQLEIDDVMLTRYACYLIAFSSPDLRANSPDLKAVLKRTLVEWGYSQMPGRLSPERMKELILKLCKCTWLTLSELSMILDRDPKALQDQYLTPMIAEGSLEHLYPHTKNHPAQAYRTKT